ncbi:MAG TPA: universal stress protein [Ktedonobacteraceae bacterium]|jgi:nucleotide-binding universal stress UspA family protein|nr:universal stress protein [Ktedonobacteraceae bacterium]
MVHLWGSKAKEETEISKSALGESTAGDIAVIIGGEQLDTNLVYLGCQMAKGAKRKVHLVHVIEVPRALPLKAVLTEESERADKILNVGMQVANRVGCEAVAEVVQAREAGTAIVDEARDHRCALILLGLVRNGSKADENLGRTIPYVLANAPCRVWLVQDPAPRSNPS